MKTYQLKYYTLLSALCSLFLILGVILQNRLISVGSIYFSGTIFVYPLSCFMLDLIAEVYGYKMAKKTLWITLLNIFIFACVVTIISKLPAPLFLKNYAQDFTVVIAPMLRTTVMGSIGILVGQFVNIKVITKLKILTQGKYFALRSLGSTFIGEIVTAFISLFGIFSQEINLHQVLSLTTTELILMFIYASLLAIPGIFIVFLLKRAEPDFIESLNFSFNPFQKTKD